MSKDSDPTIAIFPQEVQAEIQRKLLRYHLLAARESTQEKIQEWMQYFFNVCIAAIGFPIIDAMSGGLGESDYPWFLLLAGVLGLFLVYPALSTARREEERSRADRRIILDRFETLGLKPAATFLCPDSPESLIALQYSNSRDQRKFPAFVTSPSFIPESKLERHEAPEWISCVEPESDHA